MEIHLVGFQSKVRLKWRIDRHLSNMLHLQLKKNKKQHMHTLDYWCYKRALPSEKCNLKYCSNSLRRQLRLLPSKNKLSLIGPTHILSDVFIFLVSLLRLIDMPLSVFGSTCLWARTGVCTWLLVLGPIKTQRSFLTVWRPRRNNKRMLSKEKPLSLFFPTESLAIASSLFQSWTNSK